MNPIHLALAAVLLPICAIEEKVPQPRAVLVGHGDEVSEVEFSLDGSLLASAGNDDETLRLWNVATGAEHSVLTKHSRIRHVSFAPDGKTLASVSRYPSRRVGHRRIPQDSTVELWDLSTGQDRVILKTPAVIFALKYSPDGRFLAISLADFEGRTLLWDVRSEKVISTLQGDALPNLPFSNDVAFSRDGSTMALTVGADVALWDTETWRCRVTLTGHTRMSNSVSFSPDGMWVASGGDDDTCRVWYMNANNLKATLKGFHGHIDSVSFSPDSKLLVAGCRGGTLHVFTAGTFDTLLVFKAHKNVVRSVVFSPDGKLLATGSRDHTIKLWDVATLRPREPKEEGR